MNPSPYKITACGTSLEPSLNRWGLSVWHDEWRTIAEAERLAAERRSWQPRRLRDLITEPELAYALECSPGYAADIMAGRRQPTPEDIATIHAYLSAKLDRAFPRTAART